MGYGRAVCRGLVEVIPLIAVLEGLHVFFGLSLSHLVGPIFFAVPLVWVYMLRAVSPAYEIAVQYKVASSLTTMALVSLWCGIVGVDRGMWSLFIVVMAGRFSRGILSSRRRM